MAKLNKFFRAVRFMFKLKNANSPKNYDNHTPGWMYRNE